MRLRRVSESSGDRERKETVSGLPSGRQDMHDDVERMSNMSMKCVERAVAYIVYGNE